ncbi:hypothetical protein PIB30_088422 [Stylosanthes scabra]|uniref:Uncharacterized protein n=1 Tax=Stylosanthes scabra TaxID=79078 RepID=A0ABU6UT86_9FABA|nr:hypothetical protein [Stylosanthes scabra]
MARKGPSPSAKGKAKAYGPPTQASPRLAAMRSQPAANSQPETPVTQAINAPTSSLPPKKRPIQKKAGRIFFQAPKEKEVNALSSKSEPEHKIAGKEENVEEDPEEGPEEEEEEEVNPEEDPEEENATEKGVRVEDDFADY